MFITKLGHCAMLIEEGGLKILTDPGMFTLEAQEKLTGIDVVLITHDHGDHLHINSLKTILKNNPQAKVITNAPTGELLTREGIAFTLLEHGDEHNERGVPLAGYGHNHALMHPAIPASPNTGYMIGNRFFYPGDAFVEPGREVEILALPVAGPWMKLSEAIDYALKLKPKQCFPVHDGILKSPGVTNVLPPKILVPVGIDFTVLELDKRYEF